MASVSLKVSAAKCTAMRKERVYDFIQAYFGYECQEDFEHYYDNWYKITTGPLASPKNPAQIDGQLFLLIKIVVFRLLFQSLLQMVVQAALPGIFPLRAVLQLFRSARGSLSAMPLPFYAGRAWN